MSASLGQEGESDADLFVELSRLGYQNLKRMPDGTVCGLLPFLFTTGLAVNVSIKTQFYDHRFCFENSHEASQSLEAWSGQGYPSGPWIKLKGIMDGEYVDKLNPEITEKEFPIRHRG